MALAVLPAGCAASPAPARLQYIVAVRYTVEPLLVGGDREQALEQVRRDFATISKLGFNGVVLGHVEDGDRLLVLEFAREAGLTAAVPDRRFEDFVRTGVLPAGCAVPGDVARVVPREVIQHAAFHALAIGPARGTAAARRAASACRELRRRNVGCMVVGGPPQAHSGVGTDKPGLAHATLGFELGETPAIVDTGIVPAEANAPPLEGWLAQFHGGLIAGNTAGLVVDRYHRLPGDPPALVPPGGSLLPAQAAGLAVLLNRARLWGLRLHGMTAETIAGVRSEADGMLITMLRRGPRRYVLVSNEAADRFARGRVLLPKTIGGMAANRAVEVPPSADQGAGHVVDSQQESIALSVALRPKDAALFEIF
jgi:hypothetical protein